MKKSLLLALVAALFAGILTAAPSEIVVDIRLDNTSYVQGERVRGVVNVRNMSANKISVGYPHSNDLLSIDVYRASDNHQLTRKNKGAFVAAFSLKSNEGLRLETFLGDRYEFATQGRYFARPVLVHNGIRYEGVPRAFDIVPGMPVSEAVQMFSNRPGLNRVFSLLHWSRKGTEHLFVAAHDEGADAHRWVTFDLGPMMRLTPPTVSILPSGEVIVLHRNGPDSFARNVFWSLTDRLEFREAEMVRDPETAGQQRVQEIYRQAGGVEAKQNPWWKFW